MFPIDTMGFVVCQTIFERDALGYLPFQFKHNRNKTENARCGVIEDPKSLE
jgi:hypothetical protein